MLRFKKLMRLKQKKISEECLKERAKSEIIKHNCYIHKWFFFSPSIWLMYGEQNTIVMLEKNSYIEKVFTIGILHVQ